MRCPMMRLISPQSTQGFTEFLSSKEKLCVTLCTLWCISLFTACDRRELTYYMESEITVEADWSKADLDEEQEYGATLVIYPQDGSEPRILLMGERERTTVRLPQGRYDAVLFNRSFDDFGAIGFRGHETLETFEAYAREIVTRAGTRVIVSSPEKLSAASVYGFEVTEDMLGNYAPAVTRASTCPEGACRMRFVPVPLTYKVEVELHVQGLHNVREARCTLGGVPLAVTLHNGSTGGDMGAQEFVVGNPVYDEDSYTDGKLTGTLNLFGYNIEQAHDVKLKALLVDGTTMTEQALENATLTESTDENGILTLRLEAATPEAFPDTKPEGGAESGFGADVDEWGDETKTEIPI